MDRTVRVGGRLVRLTHLEKPLFPKSGFTKAHLLDYYLRAAPAILPHLRGRAVTLKRFPDGVTGPAFYEKRCPGHRPEWVPTAVVKHEGHGTIRYCEIDDAATLLWAANLGAIELHVATSRSGDPETPTSVVFDLDPGAPAGLLDAARMALLLRDALAGIGLESWAKTSGGKGVHVFVPLNTPAGYDRTKAFSRRVAEAFERRMPEAAVSRQTKSLRRGRVLIDWSQNDFSKTMVGTYCLRASGEPYVSTPVTWEEIAGAVRRDDAERLRFSPAAVLRRIERRGDLFEPVLDRKQRIPEAGGSRASAGPRTAGRARR